MACEESFSWDLSASSPENESTHSLHCIRNTVKAAIFCIWIILYANLGSFALAVSLRHLHLKRKWTPQLRSSLLMLFFALAGLLRYSLYLSGQRLRGQYILYFIPEFSGTALFLLMLRDWLHASALIHSPGNSYIGETLRTINRGIYGGIFFMLSGLFITKSLGPMIFFDDPWALNWFYVSFSPFLAFSITVLTFFLFQIAGKLIKAMEPALQIEQKDDGLKDFIMKLERLLLFSKSIVTYLPLFFFPLWMHFTSSPTSPGMQYYFYWDLVAYELMKFLGHCMLLWVSQKKEFAKNGSDSSNSRPSSPNHTTKEQVTRFTIEELNRKPSAP